MAAAHYQPKKAPAEIAVTLKVKVVELKVTN
jgi:hypothetical protein